MVTVLQTGALPLGYRAIVAFRLVTLIVYITFQKKASTFLKKVKKVFPKMLLFERSVNNNDKTDEK